MAVIQALIGLALRSLGRVVNTALGWATALLFGRVPHQRQIVVTTIAFGSIVWLVAIAGVAWPVFATWLLTFVTLPPWVNHAWIRLAMLAAAAAIPIVVGAAALLLLEPEDRPREPLPVARALFRGYRYAFGMAVTLLVTAIIAPIIRVRTLVRRWSTRHVPVVVHAVDYGAVVRDIEAALAAGGVRARRMPTSRLVRVPIRLLVRLVGGTIERLVARDLTTFAGSDVEVIIHPFDIVINGCPRRVAAVQAILTETLPFTAAYMTWTREANEIEDRLRAVWQHRSTAPPDGAETLEDIAHAIRHSAVGLEEWEALFRGFLLVERRLGRPEEPAEPTPISRRPRAS